ncbi:MAG: hypothetical protein IT371_12275 [Deltaproteobacteria bacterium]|nr:hypothetical protein [Deltaproteobacteria bacterium]
MRSPVPVMVLGNPSVTQLGVLRCYGRHGLALVQVGFEGGHPSPSRYGGEHRTVGSIDRPETQEELAALVLEVGRRLGAPVFVVPTCDRTAVATSRLQAELGGDRCLAPLPGPELVSALVFKDEFAELLRRHPIAHPLTVPLTPTLSLEEVRAELAPPCIIKPANSPAFWERYQRKCFFAEDEAQLARYVELCQREGIRAVVQERIPNPALYCYATYLTRDGTALASVGFHKRRQWPVDFGVGSLVETRQEAALIAEGNDFLRRIGHQGLAELEFALDPRDGVQKLIEVNARPIMQNRLAAAAGCDLEWLAYSDLVLGERPALHEPTEGVRWLGLDSDLVAAATLFRRGQLPVLDWLRSFAGVRVEAFFAPDDPAPFLRRWGDLGWHLAKTMPQRLAGRYRGVGSAGDDA